MIGASVPPANGNHAKIAQIVADASAAAEREAGGVRSSAAGNDQPFFDAPPAEPQEPPAPLIETIVASAFADREIPERHWLVEDWIPCRNVTLLAGDGGTGKSLLALDLAAAVSRGKRWLRLPTARGRVVYVSCEDEADELHRRLQALTLGFLGDLDDLTLIPWAGRDAILATPSRNGVLRPTPLFNALSTIIERDSPALVVIDTLADVYGGEENSRVQTRQFITMLRGLALKHDTTIVLLSHPSVAGMANGTGASGSTAWNNSVRSRLYFERVKPVEGEREDHDARRLTRNKANYARTGASLALRYSAGRFVFEDDVFGPAAERERDDDAAFLSCMRRAHNVGQSMSPALGRNYAPNVFRQMQEARGASADRLARAMERLLQRRAIQIIETGPPSKRRKELAITDGVGFPGSDAASFYPPSNPLRSSFDPREDEGNGS